MDINMMLGKQRELMEKVPHGLRPDLYPRVALSLELISHLLLYLGTCGHKPWRPNPLPPADQYRWLEQLKFDLDTLEKEHFNPTSIKPDELVSRRIISELGIIEEAIEYQVTTLKGMPGDQLEELTDIMFFYLELIINSGFTLDQIEKEYVRKHAVNLKRYEDGQKGDFKWDKRAEKTEL